MGQPRTIPRTTWIGLGFALLSLPALATIGTLVDIPIAATIAIHWIVAALVIGIAFRREELSPRAIGFRPPTVLDVGVMIGTTVAAMAVFIVLGPVIEGLGLPTGAGTGAIPADGPVVGMIAMAVTVGIVEELLYRGYAIERILAYTGNPVIAGVGTWAIFTLAHAAAWPIGNLAQIALVSAIFVAVYLARRTVFPVIGAHVAIWLLAVMEALFA